MNKYIYLYILATLISCGDPNKKKPLAFKSNEERLKFIGDTIFQHDKAPKSFLIDQIRVYHQNQVQIYKGEWGKSLGRAIRLQDFMEYVYSVKYSVDTITVLGRLMYICENDVLRSPDLVNNFIYYRLESARQDTSGFIDKRTKSEMVVVRKKDGSFVRWDDPDKEASYCLDNSFTNEEKRKLINAMKQAAADWIKKTEGYCPKFIEYAIGHGKVQEDLEGKVDFVLTKIQKKETQNKIYASAFFPDEDKFENRIMVIGDDFFKKPVEFQVGVCRHEMGHIMGLLHEHINTKGCPTETITGNEHRIRCGGDIDYISVMHYLCGGGGTENMTISFCDARGIKKFYSPEFHIQ